MTHKEFEDKCWSYYIFLENSFLHTTRYVYLSTDNFDTYSYEFDSLLLTVATEFENIIKIIYITMTGNQINPDNSIRLHYNRVKDTLFSRLTSGNIPEAKVISRDILLSPFYKFGKANTWWRAYTGIKHERLGNQHLAKMDNVLNALAAVFCLDCLFAIYLVPNPPDENNQMDILLPQSNLFYCNNFSFRACAGRMITMTDESTSS